MDIKTIYIKHTESYLWQQTRICHIVEHFANCE